MVDILELPKEWRQGLEGIDILHRLIPRIEFLDKILILGILSTRVSFSRVIAVEDNTSHCSNRKFFSEGYTLIGQIVSR